MTAPHHRFLAALGLTVLVLGVVAPAAGQQSLTNVSYDPTRELYAAFNQAFAAHYLAETGQGVTVTNTHGGSAAQIRTVMEGLPADVVTMPLAGDIFALEDAGLVQPGWQQEFPLNSSPYLSTIVFLVRKGNPESIHDWSDLVRDGIEVITPNPKTSGGARWNFLAAWAYELDRTGGDEAAAQEFVHRLYTHVTVLDTGARGSTNTFVQNGIGDVLLAWENEAFLALRELGDDFEIVVPALSILAEPPVAIVDRYADQHGTQELAKAYLDYLYSEEGQRIIAANFFRPQHPEFAQAEDAARFPELRLVTVGEVFGGWREAQARFFAEGGVFDQIYSTD
jgi:sulfate transport system substrate-binding protein